MDVDVEESQPSEPSQSLSQAISISNSQTSAESLPDSNAQSLSQAISISDSNSQSLSQSHSESQPLSQEISNPDSQPIPEAPSNSDSQSQSVPESPPAILGKEPLVPCPNCGLLCAPRNLQKHIDKGNCAKGLKNAERVQCDICFGWFGVHGFDAHYEGCLRKGLPEDRGRPKKITRTSNVPSIASFFPKAMPAGPRERDVVFGEDSQPEPEPKPAPEPEPEPHPEPEPAAEFEDAEPPLLPSFHGDRVDAGVQCMFPFMPPAFPVQTPNALLKVTELQCTWSMDSADKDTAEQERLRAQFIKQWRECGPLNYTYAGLVLPPPPPESQVQANPPFRTPEYGGGDNDVDRLRREKVGKQPRVNPSSPWMWPGCRPTSTTTRPQRPRTAKCLATSFARHWSAFWWERMCILGFLPWMRR